VDTVLTGSGAWEKAIAFGGAGVVPIEGDGEWWAVAMWYGLGLVKPSSYQDCWLGPARRGD